MCVDLCSSGKWGFLPWFYLVLSLISVPWHAPEDWGVLVVDPIFDGMCHLCPADSPGLHTPKLTGVVQFLQALSSLSVGFAPKKQNFV